MPFFQSAGFSLHISSRWYLWSKRHILFICFLCTSEPGVTWRVYKCPCVVAWKLWPTQVSTFFHGYKGRLSLTESFSLREKRSLCVLKQVSHQEIMVEQWVINDVFCSLRLDNGTREKKFIALLSKYCDISPSTVKFPITFLYCNSN